MPLQTLVPLGALTLTAYLLHLTPRLMRSELFFGVTVSPNVRESDEGLALTRTYRLRIWSLFALAALAFLAAPPARQGAALVIGVWGLLIGGTLAWRSAHRQALAWAIEPDAHREALIGGRAPQLPGNWLLWVAPFAILGAAALYLYAGYDALPQRLPAHWNASGVADRFVPKSLAAVLRLPLIGMVICASMGLTAYSLSRHGRRIAVRGARAENESRFRKMTYWILVGVQYYIALLFTWIAVVMPSIPSDSVLRFAPLALAVLPLPLVLYLTVRYGQGGERLAQTPTATLGLSGDAAPLGDRTPDECWKWGQIYYNPADAAVWVEKRAGVGYTLNFGRPLAWLILIVTVAGPLAVVRFLR